ncbi:MAG: CpsD/CapB family tyrosine-protein kinase [Pseudomonadota bacterium]
MERIKEALDKARAVRNADEASAAAQQQAKPPRTSLSPSSSLSELTYEKTRVFTPDEALLERNRIVAHTKSDKRSGYFDILRTQVLQKMRASNAKTLAVTSPSPKCGKTLIAINLAYSIAQNTTDSVLLVDFDLRRPSIGKYLGVEEEPSLFDYLQGSAQFEDILVNPNTPRLVIAHNNRPITNASETLASQQVAAFIKEVGERYPERVVIFDLPPLLNVDDTLVVLPHVDSTLLVVTAGQSKPSEVRECQRLLSDANMIGTVVNKSEARAVDYY